MLQAIEVMKKSMGFLIAHTEEFSSMQSGPFLKKFHTRPPLLKIGLLEVLCNEKSRLLQSFRTEKK